MGRVCLRQEQKLSNVEKKRRELGAFVELLEDPAAKGYFSDLFAMAYGRILSHGKLNWEQYNFLMSLPECVEHCVPKSFEKDDLTQEWLRNLLTTTKGAYNTQSSGGYIQNAFILDAIAAGIS